MTQSPTANYHGVLLAVAVVGHSDDTFLDVATAADAGFDYLFANQIGLVRTAFEADSTPFHLLGLGVCAFLEAALGMESGRQTVYLSKLAGKGEAKGDGGGRFAAGLEWEILNADSVVLLGLTHALSESCIGYFQCMYALNTAHGKFTKLWKAVFPSGLEGYASQNPTPVVSRSANVERLAAGGRRAGALGRLAVVFVPELGVVLPCALDLRVQVDFWAADKERAGARKKYERQRAPEGPVEEMIVAGTVFAFGLFNLVFSLLPKVQTLVDLFGFKHDRALALRALEVSFSFAPWLTTSAFEARCIFLFASLRAPRASACPSLWRAFRIAPAATSTPRSSSFCRVRRVPPSSVWVGFGVRSYAQGSRAGTAALSVGAFMAPRHVECGGFAFNNARSRLAILHLGFWKPYGSLTSLPPPLVPDFTPGLPRRAESARCRNPVIAFARYTRVGTKLSLMWLRV
ncbi:hypothetical protein B0H17DRAFT_1331099 [Mycena rosella]|uniref:Uncharacterized protein n=1 Tax=Mycena rosella TaxID=1033263 RepID=A0AAD7DHL0_MYCRO|nr:hypothetical protein B0H17DRAFT_1331099 [Mycena rosella]